MLYNKEFFNRIGQKETFEGKKNPRMAGFFLTIVIVIWSRFLSTSCSTHSEKANSEKREGTGFGHFGTSRYRER